MADSWTAFHELVTEVPEGSVNPASHAGTVAEVSFVIVTVPEYPPHQVLETVKLTASAAPDGDVVVTGAAVVVVLEVVVEVVVDEVVVDDVVVDDVEVVDVVGEEAHPVAKSPEGLPAFLELEETVKPKLVEAPGASWAFQLALPKR